MKVLLVDDSALFLEGLGDMLRAHGLEVLAAVTEPDEVLPRVESLSPDVVLMDIQMPGQSGIEVTRRLHAARPDLRIVMMTVSEEDQDLYDSIAAGACGYLLKGDSGEPFVAALEGMARGEAALSPGLAAKIMAEFARRDRARSQAEQPSPKQQKIDLLTERQQQILQKVSAGHSYREVARHLQLAEITIRYHMGEIIERLHVENRSQAIAVAGRILPPSARPGGRGTGGRNAE